MHNQTWKDLQDRPESLLTKICVTVFGGACLTLPILYGILQYTN